MTTFINKSAGPARTSFLLQFTMRQVSLLLLGIALTTLIPGTRQGTIAAEFSGDVDKGESGTDGAAARPHGALPGRRTRYSYASCKTTVPYKPVVRDSHVYCCGDTVKLASDIVMKPNKDFWYKFKAEVKRAVHRAIKYRCKQCHYMYYNKKQ